LRKPPFSPKDNILISLLVVLLLLAISHLRSFGSRCGAATTTTTKTKKKKEKEKKKWDSISTVSVRRAPENRKLQFITQAEETINGLLQSLIICKGKTAVVLLARRL
jgi:hypothetical protein